MKHLMVVCVAGLLLAGSGRVGAQGSAQAEKLLEGARRKEVVEGDLRSAIEQYARIVEQFKSQPEIAARALYQLAQCQEKLGQAEARKSYERILREYAGSAEFASAARTRLAAMQPSSARAGDLRTQLLWDHAVDLWGTTSADGRLLSFVDWDTGDLAVRDLVTNQSRRLTDKGGYAKAEGEAEGSAMSPDGKFVAFTWDRWDKDAEKEGNFQLRIVGTDGKGERVVMPGGPRIWLEPQSWSPDGKWITVVVREQDKKTNTITLVSPDGVQKRPVATVTARSPMKSTFSPDGRWIAFHLQSSGDTPQREAVYVVRADRSTDSPAEVASNARFLGWAPGGSAILITKEWNERRELYALAISDGRATGEPRVVAGAPEAYSLLGVTTTGTLIYGKIVRSTDAIVTSIDTATATVGKLVPEMPVASYGMGGTVGGMRFSPDGKYALFVRARDTFVVRTLADGSERRLAPQLADIGPVEWASDNRALLIAGRSGGQQGVFRVDIGTGAAKLLFAHPGAWILAPSPDGHTIYYKQPVNPSNPSAGRGAIVARDLNTGAERTLLAAQDSLVLDLRLSRDGTKLLLLNRNQLRILDVASADLRILFDNRSDKRQPRFWGADWSADGRYVLANVNLTAPGVTGHELWSLPVDGGEPIRKVMESAFRGLWLSPDGTRVGMMRWSNLLQVWSLDNFLPARQRKS